MTLWTSDFFVSHHFLRQRARSGLQPWATWRGMWWRISAGWVTPTAGSVVSWKIPNKDGWLEGTPMTLETFICYTQKWIYLKMKWHQSTTIFVCHDFSMDYVFFSWELHFQLETNHALGWLDEKLRIDKYTPEACSIIGNYYSLKGEHEKAVVYFQMLGQRTFFQHFSPWQVGSSGFLWIPRRALSLNRHFTPVSWMRSAGYAPVDSLRFYRDVCWQM